MNFSKLSDTCFVKDKLMVSLGDGRIESVVWNEQTAIHGYTLSENEEAIDVLKKLFLFRIGAGI